MFIVRKKDGTLLVPWAIHTKDAIIDGYLVVSPDSPDYKKWLRIFKRQQQLLKAKSRAKGKQQ